MEQQTKDLRQKSFDDFIPAVGIPRNLASFIGWNSHRQPFLVKSLYEVIERYAAYREQQANETKDIAIEALRVQSRDIKRYEAYCKELENLLTEDQYKEAHSRAIEKVPDLPLSEIPSFEQQAKHAGFIEGAEQMVRDVIVFLEIVAQRTPEFPIEEMKGVFQEAMRIVVEKVESMTLPTSPYAPREKGGENV